MNKAQRDSERVKSAVKNGFCGRCIKNPIDLAISKRYCPACFAKKSQADREYRESHKEQLKQYFKTLDKTPERKVKSKIYRDRRADKESIRDKKVYEFRKANNLCVRCGRNPPVIGVLCCRNCKEKFQKHHVKKKAELLSAGLCLSCRKPNGNGKSLCDKCTQEGVIRLRAWKIANPDRVKSGNLRYFKENKEKSYEKVKRWNKANPEKCSASRKRRHYKRDSLERDAAGSFTAEEWSEILEKYGNKCLYCERIGIELTVDHVVPLSRGGTSYPSNLQPLCVSCNSKKKGKIIDFRPFGNAILDWT